MITDVRGADAIEVEIGANDVGYDKRCGTTVSCYSTRIPELRKNLTAIVHRVRALTRGRERVVVLLDYWSVWLGGKYAEAQGAKYVTAAEQVTTAVNAAIRSTAAPTGSAYVDLRAAFKGPNYRWDETNLLSSDGDHPNAAGHRRIATAAKGVIAEAFHTR